MLRHIDTNRRAAEGRTRPEQSKTAERAEHAPTTTMKNTSGVEGAAMSPPKKNSHKKKTAPAEPAPEGVRGAGRHAPRERWTLRKRWD